MVAGVNPASPRQGIVIVGSLDTVTTAADYGTTADYGVRIDNGVYIFRQSAVSRPPAFYDRRIRDEAAEPSGYVGSRRAFYESPRVDRSSEETRPALAAQVFALPAARRKFGAPRDRVPVRSRPGANALAA